ncbi:hypothetical protein JCGZ_15756 [Jatropha curcas]|uniref:Protein kinase domain-containing protein n=1 Tax=Jatropha curcas TaxID=180498 RepID=A0A067LB62_JATCU|nr:hypothetical protein JCGZ_15756 [Jatropha curcas]
MYPWYCSIFTLLCLYFLFDSITCASTNTSSSSSTEKSKILLNCGSAESVSFNGKNWTGDRGSKFMPPDYERSTTISVASSPLIVVPEIPYSTARVFHSHFSYAFPFSPGFKFIRLHFYPSSSYFNARFSVVSGQYTLLNNFSPHIMAETLQSPYFTKDFVVYLKDNILDISFIPSSSPRGAYAFVNGIEIYNFPSNFSNYAAVSRKPAFEILHRVIMRTGSELSDKKEQWQWIDDSSFIFGNSTTGSLIYAYETIKVLWGYMSEYAAPTFLYDSARIMGSDDAVNLSYNLTWRFLVETGFKYLVRLHLCEISYDVTEVNQRVFTVYINNRTVEKSLDVIALAGAPFVAIFKDYVVMVPEEETGETNQKLWLALHPNSQSKPKFQNAILNGVEIIKISDANNNLASSVQSRIGKPNNKIRLIMIIIGCVVVCSGGTLILCFILYRRRKMNSDDHSKVSAIPSTWLCYQFKLSDIKLATNNFSEALVIGEGGFGKVYRGSINGGTTQVAIKRKGPKSQQGMQEFLTEIDLLPTIHHMNLVSLLGFCQEHNELILVYEYMPCGTLRDHLYKGSNNPPLSWNQRLKICIGAARGLHYLHCGTKNSIIHRDIKSVYQYIVR